MSLALKYLSRFAKSKELKLAKKYADSYFENFLYKDKKVLSGIRPENVQKGFLNFYEKECINPYIPRGACGPWIVSSENNNVIYDIGGYGMLGLGHNNRKVLRALSLPQTMANVMTPSFSHKAFYDMFQEKTNNTYKKIVCLNSGSDANSFACRLANVHNKRNPVLVHMNGSFHGRTEIPSILSDSCRNTYVKYLYDFRQIGKKDDLEFITKPWGNLEKQEYGKKVYSITPNCVDSLQETFEKIGENNEYPELTIFEPVLGEGNPGLSITPKFYKKMRELTRQFQGILLADSVQAGLRCNGVLSIVDYPGFKDLEAPDMETFSKALNGGQYPLSVVGLGPRVAHLYRNGLYGNTMTSNPRALDVAMATLSQITPEVQRNITRQGKYFLGSLKRLEMKYDFVDDVNGTGLLMSLFLNEEYSNIDVEMDLRRRGLGVIHGGGNSIRFTPWFLVTEEEIDMVCEILDDYFDELE